MAAFCWSAMFRLSARDNGRVIQAGSEPLALVFWAATLQPPQPASNSNTNFFMGKNPLTAVADRPARPRFGFFSFGQMLHGGKREARNVIRQPLDGSGIQRLLGKQLRHHPPAVMIKHALADNT